MKPLFSNTFNMNRSQKAFTMIELVFVIVVLGILATIALPRFDRDLKQEAADNILSDIKLTQHMALVDFRHEFDEPKWQRSFWRIEIESCGNNSGLFVSVGSDKDYDGSLDEDETAIDPSNGHLMSWSNGQDCTDGGDSNTSERIFITHKFGVQSVTGAGGCAGVQHIGFDHLGRPHVSFSNSTTPDYSSYMTSDCNLTFTMSDDDTFDITIKPETGHVFIVGQEDS